MYVNLVGDAANVRRRRLLDVLVGSSKTMLKGVNGNDMQTNHKAIIYDKHENQLPCNPLQRTTLYVTTSPNGWLVWVQPEMA